MNEGIPIQGEFENSPLVIERARPEDAEAIFAVKRDAMLDGYADDSLGITAEALRRKLEGRNGELVQNRIERIREMISGENENGDATFVARLGDQLVGYAMDRNVDDERRISFLFVNPVMQGQGVGSRLLDSALQWWGKEQDITLLVRDYNQSAIEMYKRRGFEIDTEQPTDNNKNRNFRNIKMRLRADSQLASSST